MPFNLIQPYNVNTAGDYVFDDVQSTSANVSAKFIANSTQVTINAVPLAANGGTGTAGHVLISNGSTGSPYWGDAASVIVSSPLSVSNQAITSNIVVLSGTNGSLIGPLSLANGLSISIANNARLVIL
jgi:outer membrane protein assembly factor BamB